MTAQEHMATAERILAAVAKDRAQYQGVREATGIILARCAGWANDIATAQVYATLATVPQPTPDPAATSS